MLGWAQKVGLSGEEEVDPAPLTWGLPGVGQSQPRGGEVGSRRSEEAFRVQACGWAAEWGWGGVA